MQAVQITDSTINNVADLCRVCVSSERRSNPAFVKGIEEKTKWAREMLEIWSAFAKIAYVGNEPVALVQFQPIPNQRVVYIYCIFVAPKEHWQKGIGSQLLANLIDDMRQPKAWFNDERALALVTKTFHGEPEGELPARDFFLRRGFKQSKQDHDLLYYPLVEGFTISEQDADAAVQNASWTARKVEYVPQKEDKGKAVIIYGPTFCPWSYPFLARAEKLIREVSPQIEVRWISKTDEPAEVDKRGEFYGCTVNARAIRATIFDKEAFQREVREALVDT